MTFTPWSELTGEKESTSYSKDGPQRGFGDRKEASRLLEKASDPSQKLSEAEALAVRRKYRGQSASEISSMQSDLTKSNEGFAKPGEAGTDEGVPEDLGKDEGDEGFQILKPANPDEVDKRLFKTIAASDMSVKDDRQPMQAELAEGENDHWVGVDNKLTDKDLRPDTDEYDIDENTVSVRPEKYPDGLNCIPMPDRVKNHDLRTFLKRSGDFVQEIWRNSKSITIRTNPLNGEMQFVFESGQSRLVISSDDFSNLMSVPQIEGGNSKISLPHFQTSRNGERFEVHETVENVDIMDGFLSSIKVNGNTFGENHLKKPEIKFRPWYKKVDKKVYSPVVEKEVAEMADERKLWHEPPETDLLNNPGWPEEIKKEEEKKKKNRGIRWPWGRQ